MIRCACSRLFFYLPLLLLTVSSGVYAQTSGPVDTAFHPFVPDYFHRLEIAHRGGYANGPENTLETMLLNVRRHGITCFEIDVMMTADSELVIFHDETISRVLDCDQPLRVDALTLAQLRSYPLRDSSLGKVYVPTLRMVVDTLGPVSRNLNQGILIELDFKPRGTAADYAIDQLIDMARNEVTVYGEGFFEHFFVSSFYPYVLQQFNKKEPRIHTGFAVNSSPDSHRFLAVMAQLTAPFVVKKYQADIFEPNHCRVTPAYLRRWKKRGVLLNVYTVNSACDKAEVKKWGVCFTSNCPGHSCGSDPSDQMGKRKRWCKRCS